MTTTILRRVRRIVVGAAVAGVVSLSVAADGADASRNTKSEAIAGEASRAVAALERWTDTQNPTDYVRFIQRRDRAAAMIETDLDARPGSLRTSWASAPITKQHALLNAMSQLGVPYRNLASEPGVGFDCSGLTIWAFDGAGVEIPRISRDQIDESKELELADAEPGDLVYYPGHVSIFLGADLMVHSPNSGSHVEVTDLPDRSLRFGDAVESPDA